MRLLYVFFARLFKLFLIVVLAGITWFTYEFTNRPGLEEYARYIAAPAVKGLTIRWLGTAAVLVSDGETSLLIDPYFSRPSLRTLFTQKIKPDEPLVREWLVRSGAIHPDAVLVSHSHIDHALDAPFIAKETGADILGSASTAVIAEGQGVLEGQIKTVVPGKAVTYGKFTVRFIKSQHGGWFPQGKNIAAPFFSPTWAFNYRMGEVYSILIEHPEGTILHHASAGFIPGNLDNYRADVVLLGIALRPDLQTYMQNVVLPVHAKTVIPIHWDDFFLPLGKPLKPLPAVKLNRFFHDMKTYYPAIKVRTLPLNVRVKPSL